MKKKDLPLILGLSLPLLVVAAVLLSNFLSHRSYQPQYNFLYSMDKHYDDMQYAIQNGKVILQPKKNNSTQGKPGELRIYDVKKDASNTITLEQTQQLNLSSNPTSFDGYTVKTRYDSNDFLPIIFVPVESRGIYLTGHNSSSKLNIKDNKNYWGFHFIGWITNDKR